ncbi:12799_t:CDS:2, partial [Dentiscutata heterogama]
AKISFLTLMAMVLLRRREREMSLAYNRTVSKVDRFFENEAKGINIISARSIEDLVKRPDKIILLVKAGSVIYGLLNNLYLDKDIIIDGYFPNSIRKYKCLKEKPDYWCLR